MKIDCIFGKFKIIQSVSDNDELLILSKWDSLKRLFEENRIFLVNQKDGIFGVYLRKKECVKTMDTLVKNVDYRDWDHLHLGKDKYFVKREA